ncbi:MAG TPA: M3 family oligoendopeptidase [Hyphomicrobiaceae bacterium]|jgi:oligoendopeptidase F|nr:M3 family oligoendopeptidase [Hyphomicrobiaceae bacterium]
MSATKELDLGPMPVWDLRDLYPAPDSEAVRADLEKAASEAKHIKERYEGKLAALAREGAPFAEAISAYESLGETLGRLGAYAGLLYASDRSNPEHARFYGNIQEQLTAISTQVIFFELEINRLEDAELARALTVPAVARYKPWLEDLRKEKPYQLEERLERLFHEKSLTAYSAWNRLFDETMAALRFAVKGEPAPLPIEPTLNFLLHPDGARRQAGAEALAQVFKDNIRLFTLITNTLAKDKEIADRWRGFKDVADSRHLANRVEGEVVQALVSAVREAYPKTAHRYYALKARWLGKPRLAYWDRNAPLPDRPDRTVTWAEARATVLNAYGAFEPRMAAIAERFFDRNWIDAPVREGKAPGAFSHPTVPSVHPYILMNYQGKPRDVMTLAHELGHGVHQTLAAPLGPLLAQTPLTLAETASVFGEMLTFKTLLAGARDAKERKALLAQKAEDMINTVMRQIAFYAFERRLHEERRAGELTSERIGQIWLEVQGEGLGPAIELTEGYETYWCYVPHFVHSPFYVYAYAFGDCLVNSLYGLYQDAHPGFVGKYVAMLEAGGSKHHSELLKPFGLDATQRAFWQKGLKVLETMIDELEKL